ncbi:glycosyltransferase family 10 domain-containing protein [Sulfitobacter marinus]|nr:glycosyltransferase family 10 [Sulfitobacter marinus]
MSFGARAHADALRGYDHFASMPVPPQKHDKIAIVTSNKVHTEFHKSRLVFLEALMERIPEYLDVYGRGFKTIDDKADALWPHKYHIALENCTGRDTWTEKVADPFLCWSFPFYSGCTNLAEYFPEDSFLELDTTDPDKAAQTIKTSIETDLWSRSLPALTQARELILEKYNIAQQLVKLAQHLLTHDVKPADAPRRWIWSERALWPEPSARGSIGQWALRNAIMLFDPGAELKTVGLRNSIEAARNRKRARKLAVLEGKKRD